MLKKIKTHTLLNSTAGNFANPYFSYVAASISSSNTLVGYVQGLGIFNSITQLLTGNLVDRKNNRIRIILISSSFLALLCISLYYFQDPLVLSLLFTAIVAIQGVYGGAWNALIGELSEPNGRGRFLSNFAFIAEIGAIIAMLLAIPLSYLFNSFTPAFIISGILFLLSATVLLNTPEIKIERKSLESSNIKTIRDYYLVNFIYGIFWGFAWPLFTITQVRVLKMKPYEYAIAQALGAFSVLIFQPIAGRIVDKNRRLSMFAAKFSLIVFPIGFYFASSPIHIYLINAFTGLIPALINVAYTAYLYDLVPPGYRGRFSAEFNMVNNLAGMIGSLSGASLVDYLNERMDLTSALGIGYLIAVLGRASTSFLYLRFGDNKEKRI
ncbi:MAG: MFS transporter [Thermoproteota archaeon]|nr:MFS transporter [Thermoproteota archaeon]